MPKQIGKQSFHPSLSAPWCIFVLLAECVFQGVTPCWAQSSLPLPRTSSSTEQSLQDEALYLKEETVSIASRYEQPISEAPSNVYVITDEDIRTSGATDVPTLLRRVPGVEVMQTNAADFNVSVRGNNQLVSNKLLVLIDGRSVYIDQAGLTLWKLLPVTLTAIKRIEVLKGPASALYGFNAFDGVVNIITKSPEEMKGTTLQIAGGELGTVLTSAVHAGQAGAWGYRLSAGHEQNQRWSDHNSQALNTQNVMGLIDYRLSSDSRVYGEAGFLTTHPYTSSVSGVTSSRNSPIHHAYGRLGYERGNFHLQGWYSGYHSNTVAETITPLKPLFLVTDRAGDPVQRFNFNTYNLEGYYHTTVFQTMTLGVGANYRRIISASNLLAQRTGEDRLGLFSQATWKLTSWVEIIGGVRYDLDTFITPTLSPHIALLIHMRPEQILRFSRSTAVRPPTTLETSYELSNLITLPGSPPFGTAVLGSTTVRPEKITSYELEYQGWWWQHRLRTRVTAFYNHISDLIEVRNPTGIPNHPAQPINGGLADIYGTEAGVEWLATPWLSGFANYAYQDGGQTFQGFSRRGFPHHKINAGLRLTWAPGVSGEVLYHHVGAAAYPLADAFISLAPFFPPGTVVPQEQVRSYNLLNLRVGYRFWQETARAGYQREAELALSVFNALNDNHREHPLGDLLGTRVMGWLTVKL